MGQQVSDAECFLIARTCRSARMATLSAWVHSVPLDAGQKPRPSNTVGNRRRGHHHAYDRAHGSYEELGRVATPVTVQCRNSGPSTTVACPVSVPPSGSRRMAAGLSPIADSEGKETSTPRSSAAVILVWRRTSWSAGPARIAGLDRALAHMRNRVAVWFARRDEIDPHWLARLGTA